MDRLKMPEGEAIEAGIVTRSIESAQRKVEARNFDMRKQLLEYDDVANDQRKVIYQQRNEILDATELDSMITAMREDCISDVVRQYVPAESMEEQWDVPGLEKALAQDWQVEVDLVEWLKTNDHATDEEILERAVAAANAVYQAKVDLVGSEQFMNFQRAVLLQSFDTNWRDHLAALDYLRQGIHLRGYAQKQPKQEYKREAFELFRQLIDQVKNEVTRVLLTVRIQQPEALQEAAAGIEHRAEHVQGLQYASADGDKSDAPEAFLLPEGARVGRNDPCPCGSGEKFKNCHGKLS
jgi:Preprotein translocase subunit SecA (ATPase, RNA helicase)